MNRKRRLAAHVPFAVVTSLLLAPASAQSQIVSGVTTALDSSAVAGVTVTLRTSSGQIAETTRSAGDGSFQLAIPENGEYRIRADAPGYLPTESLLFELRADGQYAIDVEMSRSMSQPVSDLPRELYEDWVRRWVDSWQTRDVEMVLGQEWRDAAAGRDLLEALRQTDLPLEGWVPHPRFPGRICPRARSSAQCASVAYMTHETRGDLRDVHPSAIEAVIWIGSMISSGPSPERMAWDAQFEVERVILFARGYLTEER